MIGKLHTYKVGIFGAGQIGLAIREMLEENSAANMLYVTTYDKFASDSSIVELDIPSDINALKKAVEDNDIIISALPYDVTGLLAEMVIITGNRVYLDLTEDVAVAKNLLRKNAEVKENQSIMIPHCGLAPGAVSIIAADLFKGFDKVTDVKIRVGALPVSADNALKYNLAWSTSGLVNEYCNPCPAVVDGKSVVLQPLDNLTSLTIDGAPYEAFNTSGGLGTFGLTLTENSNRKINGARVFPYINACYQTIRYPGHRDLMKFLLDDLGFRHRKEELITIFDREIPRTSDDCVIIDIKVTGKSGMNELATASYGNAIINDDRFTAIQRTTAGGICAVVYWLVHRLEDDSLASFVVDGSIRNEFIPLPQVEGYQYWPF